MKIKIITADFETDKNELESQINEFIKGKEVIDIKFTKIFSPNGTTVNAYILYEDLK